MIFFVHGPSGKRKRLHVAVLGSAEDQRGPDTWWVLRYLHGGRVEECRRPDISRRYFMIQVSIGRVDVNYIAHKDGVDARRAPRTHDLENTPIPPDLPER